MLLLPIFNYHHIGVRAEPAGHRRLWVPLNRFEEHLGFLAQEGYRCLSLRDCIPYLTGERPIPSRVAVLTFDDGYTNFYEHAFPVIRKYGFSASVYIVTGEVGGSSRWDKSWESSLMGWEEIASLSREGIEFGSHTVSHPYLSRLPHERAHEELVRSRCILEDRLGIPVRTFAYPYGDVNAMAEDYVAEAGFDLACSSDRGNLHTPDSRFRLTRVPMDGFITITRLRRRLSAIYDHACRLQRFGRLVRSWLPGILEEDSKTKS